MSRKVATPALTTFFEEQHEADPNSTLRMAHSTLADRAKDATGESASRFQQLVAEVEELIADHGEQCQVADFLPASPAAGAGTGTHG